MPGELQWPLRGPSRKKTGESDAKNAAREPAFSSSRRDDLFAHAAIMPEAGGLRCLARVARIESSDGCCECPVRRIEAKCVLWFNG